MIRLLKTISVTLLASLFLFTAGNIGKEAHKIYLYKEVGNSVVKIMKGRSGGTGFAVKAASGANFILTNAHICNIQGRSRFNARTRDGFTYPVSVVKVYEDHDLCIMSEVPGLKPIAISNRLTIIDTVFLMGHPGLRGLTLESGLFIETKTISLRYNCPTKDVFRICIKRMSANHINAISYGGNSGSPVVDVFGNVIGVLFAGSPAHPTASYMVPLKHIQTFLSKN